MSTQKILIVDDSPTERFYLSEFLTSHGYVVATAENGEDAIEHIRSDMPDLILMDVVMPGQNGFQATREIARNPLTEHVPIIICTSKSQETDRIWGLRQGARDYIVKPVNTKLLLQKIANCLRPTA
jgi:twitching motility two-component system response regulator PilH